MECKDCISRLICKLKKYDFEMKDGHQLNRMFTQYYNDRPSMKLSSYNYNLIFNNYIEEELLPRKCSQLIECFKRNIDAKLTTPGTRHWRY